MKHKSKLYRFRISIGFIGNKRASLSKLPIRDSLCLSCEMRNKCYIFLAAKLFSFIRIFLPSRCLYSCKQGMILNKFQILVKIILTCVRGVLLKNISWIPVLNKTFSNIYFCLKYQTWDPVCRYPLLFFRSKKLFKYCRHLWERHLTTKRFKDKISDQTLIGKTNRFHSTSWLLFVGDLKNIKLVSVHGCRMRYFRTRRPVTQVDSSWWWLESSGVSVEGRKSSKRCQKLRLKPKVLYNL